MEINRLFKIVYILLDKKSVTAKELAEHFEVSRRTIYRDVEALSIAGIPIYTTKGKGGGISVLPEFILNKSLLSSSEQNEILSALQSLNALDVPNIDPILNKLSLIFNKHNTSWIDVDFSHWNNKGNNREKFKLLRNAILEKTIIKFNYYNSSGENSKRIVEPLKLIFKGQDWYLYGYCKFKSDYRMFKVCRIKDILCTNKVFNRDMPQNIWNNVDSSYKSKMTTLVLKINPKMAYRLFDEFEIENIKTNSDGSFTAATTVPSGNWLYGYIMSFGEYAEVLQPKYIREEIADKLKNSLKKYL
ncbi:MAG: YafY family protein [Clostridium sp.]|nr:YafY family protein [Clostridium sp.]